MRRKLFTLGVFFAALLLPAIALAAPSTTFFLNIAPTVTDTYSNGTSASRWLNFYAKYASTTALTVSGQTTGCAQFDSTGLLTTTNSACGAGTISSGTQGQFPFYNANGTTLTATSTLFVTQAGNIGIGSTTPWGQLSVNPNALGSGVPEFAIGSSTKTHLIVDGSGKVGVGTTTQKSTFVVSGNSTIGADYNVAAPTNGLLVEGNVCFGCNNPTHQFDVVKDGGAANITMTSYGTVSPIYSSMRARGSLASPTNVLTNDLLAGLGGIGYGATTFSGFRANLKFRAAQDFTDTAQGTYFTFETTPIGTVATREIARYSDNGNVGYGTSTPFSTLSVSTSTANYTGQSMLAVTNSSSATLFNVLGNGNTGVGTTSPYANLSVQSGASTGDAFVVATSTGNAIGGYDNDGHVFTSGPAPVISTCGTGSGTVVGDDQSGTITTATAATACTATFSKAYRNTPVCTVTDDSLVGFADISAISTTAVTFGISSALTGGHLYYSCSYHK